MRVAIVGAGNIARMHAGFYKNATRAPMELVACVDINEETRKKFAEAYGIPHTYADYREMLQKEKPDIISICTWPGTHCEITLAAIEAGVKGILCEKPIAPTLAEADKMIEAANKAGVTLSIDHQLRCMPQYTKAREIIASGKLGEIKRVVGICNGIKTPAFLTDSATHTVDIMRYMMSDAPVSWVIGQIDRRSKLERYGQPGEDWAVGYWSWDNGARGTIESGSLFTGDGYHHINVSGTEGDLEVFFGGEHPLRIRTSGGWEDVPLEPGVNPVDELVAAMEEGRPHRSSGEQGRATHELLLGVYESSRKRGVAELPLENRGNAFHEMIAERQI
jgi:predicted dehydrogenase